jgi:hypothetical protein
MSTAGLVVNEARIADLNRVNNRINAMAAIGEASVYVRTAVHITEAQTEALRETCE